MPDIAFLLDEHYPPSLAAALQQAGVDAEAVIAREDLRGTPDTNVLAAAWRERRIVVTADVTTFPAAMAAVQDHSGIIYCDSQRFPRSVNALPRLASALIAFANDPPRSAVLPGFVWWLQAPGES
ncbi:MAG: DUF5615 family PIN-like protein [Propionibacteriaceae bacterium]|jgi:predicted nuclease of predicted toxin-antitoxin system|nr:DUF5615 family PIN-like protein [Propionibacteriaceae bacterium]